QDRCAAGTRVETRRLLEQGKVTAFDSETVALVEPNAERDSCTGEWVILDRLTAEQDRGSRLAQGAGKLIVGATRGDEGRWFRSLDPPKQVFGVEIETILRLGTAARFAATEQARA